MDVVRGGLEGEEVDRPWRSGHPATPQCPLSHSHTVISVVGDLFPVV